MPSILVTDVPPHGENVMVFTETVNAEQLANALRKQDHPFTDCYEVPEDQHQFYLFEPLWLEDHQEAFIHKLQPQAA
jgi:hypothetical protein